MIPQVIHYCWFGGGQLPDLAKECIESWHRICPSYEIRRWDESTFDVHRCPFARDAHAARRWAFVSDYARLRIVCEQGGVYLDTDVELVQPLDSLLTYDAFFGFQQDRTIATGLGFGALKGHPYVAEMAKAYEAVGFLTDDGRENLVPCPVRDSAILQRLGVRMDGTFQERDGVAILPADYLCPKSYESGRVRCTGRTLAIHHYDASWHGEYERADLAKRRRYARVAGVTVGQFIYRAEIRAANLATKLSRFFARAEK